MTVADVILGADQVTFAGKTISIAANQTLTFTSGTVGSGQTQGTISFTGARILMNAEQINFCSGSFAINNGTDDTFKISSAGNVSIKGNLTATGGTIGGWVINNGRLESQNKLNGSPMAYLDGVNGVMRLKGTIQLSTAYSGNISDSNIIYLPALSSGTRSLSMGQEVDDIGKVVRLFNSSSFGGGRYYIEANTFDVEESDGFSCSVSGTNYTAIIDPQEIIEMTCFEREGSTAGHKLGQWVLTGRFGVDNFKQDSAKGRFARILAMGIITGSSSSPSISGRMWDGRTLSTAGFTISRDGTGDYAVSFPSGTLTSNYYVFFTGYGDNWKGSLVNPTNTGFSVKIADDASLNDGSVSFMILDTNWWFAASLQI